MTYDGTWAASLNEKYRTDALRLFILGTKNSLNDIFFRHALKTCHQLWVQLKNLSLIMIASNLQIIMQNVLRRELTGMSNDKKRVQLRTITTRNRVKAYFSASRKLRITGLSQKRSYLNLWSLTNQPKRLKKSTARYTGPKQQRVNHLSQEDTPPN